MHRIILARRAIVISLLSIFLYSVAVAQSAIRLEADASQAARNIIHVHETITVNSADMDLFYPKWIPGEHSPTGTINDMVNFFVTVDGKPVEWQRDDVEMFAFHLKLPAGTKLIEVNFDDVSQPGTVGTANLARIKWNRLLLYPRG